MLTPSRIRGRAFREFGERYRFALGRGRYRGGEAKIDGHNIDCVHDYGSFAGSPPDVEHSDRVVAHRVPEKLVGLRRSLPLPVGGPCDQNVQKTTITTIIPMANISAAPINVHKRTPPMTFDKQNGDGAPPLWKSPSPCGSFCLVAGGAAGVVPGCTPAMKCTALGTTYEGTSPPRQIRWAKPHRRRSNTNGDKTSVTEKHPNIHNGPRCRRAADHDHAS
jgi:hypothetical protein